MLYTKQIVFAAILALASASSDQTTGKAMFQGVSNIISAVNEVAQQQGGNLSPYLVKEFYCPMTGEMADAVDDAEDMVKDDVKHGKLNSETKKAIESVAKSAEIYVKYAGSHMNCDKVKKLHEKVNQIRPFVNMKRKCDDFDQEGVEKRGHSDRENPGPLAEGALAVISALDKDIKSSYNSGVDKKDYSDFICEFVDELVDIVDKVKDLQEDGAKSDKIGQLKKSAKSFASSAINAGVKCDKLKKLSKKADELH